MPLEEKENKFEQIKTEIVNNVCSICNESLEDSLVTACGHIFCYSCVESIMSGDKKCGICQTLLISFEESKRFIPVPADIFKEEASHEEQENFQDSSKTTMINRIVRKCISGHEMPADTPSWHAYNGELEIDVNSDIKVDKDTSKVVIFSQFAKMLDVIEESFKKNDIKAK